MAQLRRDYSEFIERDVEILVIGPEDEDAFRYHWERNDYPFVGIPDPDHQIADLYGQQVNLLKMGRMPAQIVIDKDGFIYYQHYGDSSHDITSNQFLLQFFDRLNRIPDTGNSGSVSE